MVRPVSFYEDSYTDRYGIPIESISRFCSYYFMKYLFYWYSLALDMT